MDTSIPRIVLTLLAAVLVGISACTGRPETNPAQAPPPAPEASKIGIMTGSASQAGEDFRAAAEVARRYPRRVMHITFPDNFPSESVTVIAQLSGLAGEPKVRAIAVGQAIPGSIAAARGIRTLRPDVLLGFVTPHEDPDSLAGVCDLAIGPDETARAPGIVAAARGMGARSLVHYSFPRDLSRPLIARQWELLRAECARRGVRFHPVIAPDPAGNDGPEATRAFVTEDVPRQLQKLGPATAFYATSDAMQEPLIRALLAARAGYMVEQALPSPTAGYPAALEVEAGAPDSLHDAIRRRIAAAGMSGHFGTWTASVEGVAIRTMAALMMDAVDGRADLRDSATVARYLSAEAGGPVRMRRSRPGADHWLILLDRVTY